MKDPLIKGHPLHAILSDLPVGTLVAGVVFDGIALATRSAKWRFTARATHSFTLASGAATALVGLWDYQSVPPEHPTRRTGALHGYLNASVMTLLGGSLLLRREGSDTGSQGARRSAAVGLALAALGMLGISEWLGGDMVYRQGWRVMPAEQAEQLEAELHQRGDDALIAKAKQTVQEYEQEHALLP